MCLFSVFALYWNLVNNRMDFKSNPELYILISSQLVTLYDWKVLGSTNVVRFCNPAQPGLCSVHQALQGGLRVRDFVDYRLLVKRNYWIFF